MSEMSNIQPNDDWLTKQQAAQLLAVAEKTIDRLASRGEIQKATRKRPGLSPVTVFHPADLSRLKAEREQSPAPFIIPPTVDVRPVPAESDMSGMDTSRTLARHDQDRLSDILQVIAKQREPDPLYVDAERASVILGLGRRFIERAARDGKLRREKHDGRYRYRLADLAGL